MKQEQLKNFLEKYAQRIEEEIERPLHMRIGTYKGEYHQGNEDFIDIQGGIFITTHQGNLFKVYDKKQKIEDCFDIFGSESIITIEEEWFPYLANDKIISIKQMNLDIELTNIQFITYSGAWEADDGESGCIDIARKELDLVKNVASRYPFEYEYDPSEFDKNPNDLDEDWSDIKFDIKDFNASNVNSDNYDKVDAVASDFKEQLIAMLKQLKSELEWLPVRFRQEFIEEVIGSSNQDAYSIKKNCEFFSDTIMDELTEEEKNIMFVRIGE